MSNSILPDFEVEEEEPKIEPKIELQVEEEPEPVNIIKSEEKPQDEIFVKEEKPKRKRSDRRETSVGG